MRRGGGAGAGHAWGAEARGDIRRSRRRGPGRWTCRRERGTVRGDRWFPTASPTSRFMPSSSGRAPARPDC